MTYTMQAEQLNKTAPAGASTPNRGLTHQLGLARRGLGMTLPIPIFTGLGHIDLALTHFPDIHSREVRQ